MLHRLSDKLRAFFIFRPSIRHRFFLFYTVALACGLLIPMLWQYNQTNRIMIRTASQTLSQSIDQLAYHLNYSIADINNIIRQITFDRGVQERLSKEVLFDSDAARLAQLDDYYYLYDFLTTTRATHYYMSIRLYANDHLFYTADERLIFKIDDLEGKPYYVPHLQNAIYMKWFVTENNYLGVLCGIPHLNPTKSRNVAYVEIILNKPIFSGQDFSQINQTALPLYLVDNQRSIALASGPVISNMPEFNKNAAEQEFSSQGTKMLAISKPINIDGWNLVSVLPYQVIMSEYNRIRNIGLMLILILFIFSVFIALILSNSFMGRVIHLKKIIENAAPESKRIHKNNYSHYDELAMIEDTYLKTIIELRATLTQLHDAEMEQQNAELRTLQSQINSHFLYNTLDSINWMAFQSGQDNISQMVSALGKFYRFSLNNGLNFITVRDEIEITKSYLYIQKIRFAYPFIVETAVEEQILDCQTLKLVLQPFVENAIIHGFVDSSSESKLIRIAGRLDQDTIECTITDNGQGFNTQDIRTGIEKTGHGFGIESTRNRLLLYYGSAASLKIQSQIGSGTTVTIRWPACHSGS